MTDLSERIAGLSAEQRTLFMARLARRGLALPEIPRIPRRQRTGPARASFAQQRMWFLDQFEPGNPAYIVPITIRLTGRLDPGLVQQALDEIVRRHENFRTRFVFDGVQPVQVVAPTARVDLAAVDLRHLAPEARDEGVREVATELARRPFDLRECPLVRATLIRLADAEHVLALSMHHIVSDGWSTGVLVGELGALYAAFAAGRPSPLPELPVQYADFSEWQRDQLTDGVLRAHMSYWRGQLGTAAPAPLELPTAPLRPATPTSDGARRSLVLPASLAEALRALGQREGATLFMTLLAAFKVLLARYTGRTDLTVGSPIACRTRTELEPLIGCIANTLVLRTDLSGDPTFRELVGRVRAVALGAYAHQDVPFERIVEELQPERVIGRQPLFQVTFAVQNMPMPSPELPGLTMEVVRIDNRTAKFDLSLVMVEAAQGLIATAEYRTELFDGATIARMLAHFETLLRAVVAEPGCRISELPLMPEAERHRVLVEWNATGSAPTRRECVHALFEAQAERTPDALALIGGDAQLTYAELNRRANRLAHHLRRLGVGPEVLVGVCLERSPEIVVAVLGVLKAGGACVPLDPAYPAKRLAAMLDDARAPVLLTQSSLRARFPSYAGTAVCTDADRAAVQSCSGENPASRVTAGNLAYVIYTSGSTGSPKGVGVSHGAAAGNFAGVASAYGLSAADRVLQFASLNFDASLDQIFATLFSGATVVVRGPEVPSPSELAEQVATLGLTVLNLPTAYWHQLVDTWTADRTWASAGRLRLLSVGGEALLPGSVHRWGQSSPAPVRLLNAYGPTEAVVTATTFDTDDLAADDPPPARIPIGRPLAARRIYILDRRGEPVPIGVAGELHVGGPWLARGYLGRPAPTAERFVPDAFSGVPGARLYRTGDVARYRPDGNIEYLGRLDEQVKVRGYRIEPGEIVAALASHPAIRESAVLVREDAPGDRRLVGYVVSAAGERTVGTAELRQHLGAQLPDYMLPSAFVWLDALPLTPQGKVDWGALPAPDTARPELDCAYAAPRAPAEEQLAGIWAALLGVERVGVNDDFFALGGHSLTATRVVSRVREAFRVDLPLRCLFERPTVAGLVAEIERLTRANPQPPAIRPVAREALRVAHSTGQRPPSTTA